MEADEITWLFGIEKYFHFVQDKDKREFIKNIIRLKYNKQPDKPWSLRNLISDDYKKYPDEFRDDRLNFYTNVCSRDTVTTEEIVRTLTTIWPEDPFVRKLSDIIQLGRGHQLPVIFSRSQVLSKVWMAEILTKFNLNFNNILLIGGWLTHHSLYLKDINYNNLFSIDPDADHNSLVEIINPTAYVENKNITDCFDAAGNLVFYGKVLEPDLIINTSSEHMTTEWFDRLPKGSLVFIENNSESSDEHINASETFRKFIDKFPMTSVLYRGEMNFPKYKRYALYGRK